ncbi:sulfotransferase [Leucothrix sargassi]|nr:sulfotransferase [Leucothrix sargassi]
MMSTQNKKLADVIFIGPLKTATSYIYDYYLHHPDVATSEPIKELFYYDDYYDKGNDWYLEHFPHCEDKKVTIDVSPSYMIRDVALERIKRDNPNAKIVMTLRDPIERFDSHVKHHLRHGYAYDGFSKLLEDHPRIVRGSQYEKYVDQWIAAFGEDNVFILDYSELKQDPESFLRKTCDIVGVPFHDNYEFGNKVNSAAVGSVRSPVLMRGAQWVVRFLIKNGLSNVIEGIKRTGVQKLIFKQGCIPTISEEDQAQARAYLAPSVKWYNDRFKAT